jgi:hypothetical protein
MAEAGTTKTADSASTELARQRIAEDKEVAARSAAEYADRMKGKPTPTQEENDLAAHGAHILEHEHDGGDLDPNVRQVGKTSEARKPTAGGYQTRQSGPTTPPKPSGA